MLAVKHSATLFNSDGTKLDNPFQLLVTIKDANSNTVTRQQSKPDDRIFLTVCAALPLFLYLKKTVNFKSRASSSSDF